MVDAPFGKDFVDILDDDDAGVETQRYNWADQKQIRIVSGKAFRIVLAT